MGPGATAGVTKAGADQELCAAFGTGIGSVRCGDGEHRRLLRSEPGGGAPKILLRILNYLSHEDRNACFQQRKPTTKARCPLRCFQVKYLQLLLRRAGHLFRAIITRKLVKMPQLPWFAEYVFHSLAAANYRAPLLEGRQIVGGRPMTPLVPPVLRQTRLD